VIVCQYLAKSLNDIVTIENKCMICQTASLLMILSTLSRVISSTWKLSRASVL